MSFLIEKSLFITCIPLLYCSFSTSFQIPVAAQPSPIQTCEDRGTCSPEKCVVNTEPDCDISNVNTADWAYALDHLKCQKCDASKMVKRKVYVPGMKQVFEKLPGINATAISQIFKNNDALSADLCNAKTLKYIFDRGIEHAQSKTTVAAYCTEDFLVVMSRGLPGRAEIKPNTYGNSYKISGIPLPPADDWGSCRMRHAVEQLLAFKIPLKPALETEKSSRKQLNTLTAGAMAVAVDGVPWFPNYNNRGGLTWEACELDDCNAHAGKGADYHYHGDPFGRKCMYTTVPETPGDKKLTTDYDAKNTGFFTTDDSIDSQSMEVKLTHPPLTGFSLDGFLMYGRYTDSSQEGYNVPLDDCNGHTHAGGNAESYHYHATVEEMLAQSLDGLPKEEKFGPFSYTAYLAGPSKCWAGKVGAISNFYEENRDQVNFDNTKSCRFDGRNDIEDIKPCCGMDDDDYYVQDASAFVFNYNEGKGGTMSEDKSQCSYYGNKAGWCPIDLFYRIFKKEFILN